MPRYTYRCENCEEVTEIVHAMKEELHDCESCNNLDTLTRIPSTVYISGIKKEKPKEKTGTYTKRFIEESREDLKTQRKEIKRDFKIK